MKVRLRWYSAPSLTGLIAGTCSVVLPFALGARGPVWGVGLGAAFFALWAIIMYASTFLVTAVDVRACGRSLWKRTVVPREKIHAMHWNSNYISLVDSDNGELLRTASYGWTGSQLLKLSEALGVSLYDHRTMHRFGNNLKVGKLVTRRPSKG